MIFKLTKLQKAYRSTIFYIIINIAFIVSLVINIQRNDLFYIIICIVFLIINTIMMMRKINEVKRIKEEETGE